LILENNKLDKGIKKQKIPDEVGQKKIKKDEHLITKLQNIHGKYVFSSFYKCDSFEFFISRVYKIHIEKSNFLLCFVMQN